MRADEAFAEEHPARQKSGERIPTARPGFFHFPVMHCAIVIYCSYARQFTLFTVNSLTYVLASKLRAFAN